MRAISGAIDGGSDRPSRWGFAAVALLACAVGSLSAARAADAAVLDLSVGVAFIAGGLGLWRRPGLERIGTLMVALALGWGLGGVLHRGPLVHLLLTYPSGRGSRWTRPIIAGAYADAVLESIAVIDVTTLVFAIALAVSVTARSTSTRRPARVATLPAALAGIAVAAVLAIGRALDLNGQLVAAGQLVVYEVVLLASAIGLTAYLIWGRSPQSIVTGLVMELGARAEAPLRDRLARALGDPTLQIGYAAGRDPAADPTRYVDESGRPIEPSDTGTRRATFIEDQGVRVAVLVHDPSVLDDPRAVEAVGAATRIAVDNRRLREEIEARTRAIDASQRVLIGAADLERRQIEHQLDVAALVPLDHIREALDEVVAARGQVPPNVDGLNAELDAAEADLRIFARGLYPSRLASDGLEAAIGELARSVGLPVHVNVAPGRLPEMLEATAYYVCAEALSNVLKHARATQVEIDVRATRAGLEVAVIDDGVGGADPSGSGIDGLRARVEALGGRLEIISPPEHGTRIAAVVPIN